LEDEKLAICSSTVDYVCRPKSLEQLSFSEFTATYRKESSIGSTTH
jgi:hypothetical protein